MSSVITMMLLYIIYIYIFVLFIISCIDVYCTLDFSQRGTVRFFFPRSFPMVHQRIEDCIPLIEAASKLLGFERSKSLGKPIGKP